MRMSHLDYVTRGNVIIPLLWVTDSDQFMELVRESEAGRCVMKNVPRRKRA